MKRSRCLKSERHRQLCSTYIAKKLAYISWMRENWRYIIFASVLLFLFSLSFTVIYLLICNTATDVAAGEAYVWAFMAAAFITLAGGFMLGLHLFC